MVCDTIENRLPSEGILFVYEGEGECFEVEACFVGCGVVTLEAVFLNKLAQFCVSVLGGVENGSEDEQDAERHCGKRKRWRERHWRSD